jgi:hypothetical protein
MHLITLDKKWGVGSNDAAAEGNTAFFHLTTTFFGVQCLPGEPGDYQNFPIFFSKNLEKSKELENVWKSFRKGFPIFPISGFESPTILMPL